MKSTSASKYATSVAIASSFDHISERKVSDSEQIIDYYSPVHLAVNGNDTDLEDDPGAAIEPAATPLPLSVLHSSGHQRGPSVSSVNVNVGLSTGGLSQSGSS